MKVIQKFIILLFVLFVSGCHSKNAFNEAGKLNPPQKTPLVWLAHYHSSDQVFRNKLVMEIQREYRFLHPEIDLKLKFWQNEKSNYFKSSDYLVDMIQNNKFDVDLLFLDDGLYNQVSDKLNDPYWGKKYLVDFSEYEWFRAAHRRFISKDDYKAGRGGIITGPVLEAYFGNLWINTKLAKEMSIDIKKQNITIDAIHECILKVNQYNKTHGTHIAGIDLELGYSSLFDFCRFLMLSAYFENSNEEGNRQVGLIALKRTIAEMRELHNLTGKTDLAFWQAPAQMPVFNDKALLAVYPSYVYEFLRTINSQKATNLVPAELPKFNVSPKYYPGVYQTLWGVFKNSPNKEKTVELVKYICSNSVAERWVNYSKTPTGLKTKINSSKFGQNDFEKLNSYIENKYGENVKSINISKIMFGLNKDHDIMMVEEMSKVLGGYLSVDACYNNIIFQLK